MKTALDIINKIGRHRVMAGLGLAKRTVDHYSHLGVLPSAWFDFCEKETGQKLPRSLFNFKVEGK